MEEHIFPVNHLSIRFPSGLTVFSPVLTQLSPFHSQAIKNLSGCISFLLLLMSLQLTQFVITTDKNYAFRRIREKDSLELEGYVEDGVL